MRFDERVLKLTGPPFTTRPAIWRESLCVLLVVAALLGGGCSREPKKAAANAPVPKIRAVLVTIRTTMQPSNRVFNHVIIIANGKARSGDEVDVWHLYEPQRGRVITIDEIAKTHRVTTFEALMAARRKAETAGATQTLPQARLARAGQSRIQFGTEVRQWLISAGEYRRELWIGTHPQIPARLFSSIYATRLSESNTAGVNSQVDRQLAALEGFPMNDRAELPFGTSKMIVERTVTKIEQKDVPQSWLEVPKGSRDITPAAPRR